MPIQRRAAITLAVLALLVFLLYQLRDVLLPFVAGAALAYALDPVADRLERLGLGRLAATLLILATFVCGLILALIVVVPLAANQIAALVASLPAMIAKLQAIIAERAGPLIERAGGAGAFQELQSSVGNLTGQAVAWLLGFLRSLWSGSQAVVGIVSLLVVTPVVAFYLLVDWDRMIATLDRWVPPRHRIPPAPSPARSTGRSPPSSAARPWSASCSAPSTPSACGASGSISAC